MISREIVTQNFIEMAIIFQNVNIHCGTIQISTPRWTRYIKEKCISEITHTIDVN